MYTHTTQEPCPAKTPDVRGRKKEKREGAEREGESEGVRDATCLCMCLCAEPLRELRATPVFQRVGWRTFGGYINIQHLKNFPAEIF